MPAKSPCQTKSSPSSSGSNAIDISDSDEDDEGVNKVTNQDAVDEKELLKLEKEVKRLRSVNCSITRKWTTAESNLKAVRQSLDDSVRARREDSRHQQARTANEDFLKKWVVEVEEKLKTVQQERDVLNTAVQTLQQQRDALQIEVSAQKQHTNTTVATFQQQYDGLQNEVSAQQQLITYLHARCALAEAESSRATQTMTDLRRQCLFSPASQELSRIDDLLECVVCNDNMSVPWVLNCGHTFCSKCLSSWFNQVLADFKVTFTHYQPGRRTYHYQLTEEDHSTIARAGLAHELAVVLADKRYPHPAYTCPACRSPVERPPSQNYSLKDLATAVAETKGAGLPGHSDETQWHQFWPPQSELFQATL
ncbi:zinc ion binding [Marasmius sp. AFHP31]|nr:zinc ion binding [Marasmius sp. AFHP31]